MNLPTLIVGLILAAIVIFDIFYLRKNGTEFCGGDCNSACAKRCHWKNDMRKAKRKMRRERFVRQLFGNNS